MSRKNHNKTLESREITYTYALSLLEDGDGGDLETLLRRGFSFAEAEAILRVITEHESADISIYLR